MEYMETLFNIKDKIAVLTGGGGILAGEMAKGFLKAGAKVILLDINEDNLRKKVESLNKFGYDITGLVCNVLNEESVKKVHTDILNKFTMRCYYEL